MLERRDTMRGSSTSTRGGSPLPPAATLAAGLLIVGGGVALSLAAVYASGWNVPRWIGHVLAVTIALFGLQLVLVGASRLARRRRAMRFERRFGPDRAWEGDHRWTPPLVRADETDRIVPHLLALPALAGFAVVPCYLGFGPPSILVFAISGVIMALVVLFVLVRTIRLVVRRLRFGTAHLRLSDWPLHPGQRFEAQLEPAGPIGRYRRAEFVLRYVRERVVKTDTGDETRTEVRAFTEWSDTDVIEPDGAAGSSAHGHHHRGESIPVAFVLGDRPGPDARSDDRAVTALAEHPPRYWQLEVRIERDGPDFVCTFPLPVYAER